VNGTAVVREGELLLSTREVYSNCPQYIHPRQDVAPRERASVEGAALTAAQVAFVAGADTFFIASCHPDRGADASHRGGEAGFVCAAPATLSWLDFPGNNMFNTLGNLLVEPRCSLLFVDFASNHTLRIDGTASIDWGEPRRVALAITTVRSTL
jgi:uncharacterized protein